MPAMVSNYVLRKCALILYCSMKESHPVHEVGIIQVLYKIAEVHSC